MASIAHAGQRCDAGCVHDRVGEKSFHTQSERSDCQRDSGVVAAVGGESGAVSICKVLCSLLPGKITSALPTSESAANMSAAPDGIESEAIAVMPPKTVPPVRLRPGKAGEPTELAFSVSFFIFVADVI
jgi:hypothetical protein